MPVAGRGRGKFVPAKGKGKLFATGVGSITTRDTPQPNNGLGNGDTGGWGNSTVTGQLLPTLGVMYTMTQIPTDSQTPVRRLKCNSTFTTQTWLG